MERPLTGTPALWIDRARALSLSACTDLTEAADANMLVFGIGQDMQPESAEVAIRSLALEFQLKAEAANKKGLFYAWGDEASGTLRCSFCEVDSATELPFRCPIAVTTTLSEFVTALTLKAYAPSIPIEQLTPIEWIDPGVPEECRFTLLVFAYRVDGTNERQRA